MEYKHNKENQLVINTTFILLLLLLALTFVPKAYQKLQDLELLYEGKRIGCGDWMSLKAVCAR